jgi:nuclear pore complex protein Nup160
VSTSFNFESYFGLTLTLTTFVTNPYLDSLENGADWLLTDKVVSWSRTPAERGWNYLRQSLERHDSVQTDYRYSKTVLDTILTHEKGAPIPPWLVQTLEVR